MEKLNYDYIENGQIVKEYSPEADGMVYKSYTAFNSKEGICYINDYNVEYTYNDFLEEACGNEVIARWCFDLMVITWNYADSYFEDAIESDEITQCDCMYLYDHHETLNCPRCNKPFIIQ